MSEASTITDIGASGCGCASRVVVTRALLAEIKADSAALVHDIGVLARGVPGCKTCRGCD